MSSYENGGQWAEWSAGGYNSRLPFPHQYNMGNTQLLLSGFTLRIRGNYSFAWIVKLSFSVVYMFLGFKFSDAPPSNLQIQSLRRLSYYSSNHSYPGFVYPHGKITQLVVFRA